MNILLHCLHGKIGGCHICLLKSKAQNLRPTFLDGKINYSVDLGFGHVSSTPYEVSSA